MRWTSAALLFWSILAAASGVSPTLAAKTTTVALAVTTTRREKPQLDLAANLQSLLEAHASSHRSIALVERQQLHVALQELVVARGAGFDPRTAPQLGKLAAADLLLIGVVMPRFPKGQQKAGYRVTFVEDRGDELWFGGTPWLKVKSSGLYRIRKDTGEFTMYGVRDGFRLGQTYTVYDGVWVDGRLWLATSDGLAEVRPK